MLSAHRVIPHAALRRRASEALVLLLVASWLAGCASGPKIQEASKAPEFRGAPFRNVLVVGVAHTLNNRKIFEDNFVQSLKARGTGAAASYPLAPEQGAVPREKMRQAVAQSGADSVLVTRVLRVQRTQLMTPGSGAPDYYRDDFTGWYARTWDTAPPPVEKFDVLTIQSVLWDARQEKAVWSGTSESTANKDLATLTGELASVLIARMKADGVL
jgi:hypothetical protein